MNYVPTACIVGAGVSGITAAHYLRKVGFQTEILEATDKIGGRAGSLTLGNRRIDIGGKNIGKHYNLFRRFVSEMGPFEYERLGMYTTFQDGQIRKLTHKSKLFTLRNFVDLMGVKEFARMAKYVKEIVKDSKNNYLGGPFFRQLSEALDDSPITEHFGKDLCWKFLRLIIVRNSGAEPDEFYAGNLGHIMFLLSGPARYGPLECLVHGIYSVFDRFAETATILHNTRVTDIIIKNGRVVGVKTQNTKNQTEEERQYDAVVITTPANACANILRTSLPGLIPRLQRVRYNPLGVAVVQYDSPVFNKGFNSVTFDRNHPIFGAGSYVASEPELVRYSFSGGKARKIFNQETSPEEAISVGERELQTHLGLNIGRRVDYAYRYYKGGLTSHSPRHHHLLDQIKDLTEKIEGLALSGDYLMGNSLEGCCRASKAARDKIAADIRHRFTITVPIHKETQTTVPKQVVANAARQQKTPMEHLDQPTPVNSQEPQPSAKSQSKIATKNVRTGFSSTTESQNRLRILSRQNNQNPPAKKPSSASSTNKNTAPKTSPSIPNSSNTNKKAGAKESNSK